MFKSENVEKLQTQQKEPGESVPGQVPPGAAPGAPADPFEPAAAAPGVAEVSGPDLREGEANSIIKNHVIASMGLSLIPVPLVDLVALSGVQLKMLHNLARLYQVPFSENAGKSLIAALVGGVMPTSTAMTVASFAKVIPGLGTAAGVVSVSALGGATTYAIGNVFMQHFETGGTLLDFEPARMREYFAAKLQEGRQVASRLRRSPGDGPQG